MLDGVRLRYRIFPARRSTVPVSNCSIGFWGDPMASAAYNSIIAASQDFLRCTGALGPDNSKSNKEILSALKDKIKGGTLALDVTDGTMLAYLSWAANNDAGSTIVSGGPHGGYWLDPSARAPMEEKETDEQEVRKPEGGEITIQERDLYPLVELWLEQKGYRSKDMSNLKAGGRWGNPDIIGAHLVELFGATELELASCEIKLSIENWERVIFEAISHKRFSNRSWFCYRVSGADTPLPKGMEYYAERYRVGVVQVVLSDEDLIALNTESKLPLDYIERVRERVPALYDPVPLREKRDLIDRTGITLTLKF